MHVVTAENVAERCMMTEWQRGMIARCEIAWLVGGRDGHAGQFVGGEQGRRVND
jgi:hypothetical protein